MSLFNSIVVVELPPLRPEDATVASLASPPAVTPSASSGSANGSVRTATQPKFVLVLPHGDPNKLPRDVLSFCFPDLAQLASTPFTYEHTAEEYTFTLTSRDQPRMYGFCRRYRVGTPAVGNRLDLSPFSSADESHVNNSCTFQCVCILSER